MSGGQARPLWQPVTATRRVHSNGSPSSLLRLPLPCPHGALKEARRLSLRPHPNTTTRNARKRRPPHQATIWRMVLRSATCWSATWRRTCTQYTPPAAAAASRAPTDGPTRRSLTPATRVRAARGVGRFGAPPPPAPSFSQSARDSRPRPAQPRLPNPAAGAPAQANRASTPSTPGSTHRPSRRACAACHTLNHHHHHPSVLATPRRVWLLHAQRPQLVDWQRRGRRLRGLHLPHRAARDQGAQGHAEAGRVPVQPVGAPARRVQGQLGAQLG